MTWMPGTYDPELNLIYWGTGNPNPVFSGQGRKGDNLWTASIVALYPDTGKLVWGFQGSPHDTHDWDNVETPVLFNGTINGQPRKLLAQAARNGYFFVLDRTNGKSIVSTGYTGVNWSKGVDAKGQPIPDPAKDPHIDGVLINTPGGGGTNWPPPSFDPESGLFFVQAREGYAVAYLTDTSEDPGGYGGGFVGGYSHGTLKALDYQTGKIRWQHEWPIEGGGQGGGILTTAGRLLFTGDASTNLIAFDPPNGKILWHFPMQAPLSNGPMTFELGGTQYIVAGAGDTLYTFAVGK
jgi:glucose dehydrogenase